MKQMTFKLEKQLCRRYLIIQFSLFQCCFSSVQVKFINNEMSSASSSIVLLFS